MKKPSDHLFRLIQAMTPAEKRYFKIHSPDSDTALMQLFDAVNKMSDYDEALLKSQLPANISKNLKVFKIQLQQQLLRSLKQSSRNTQVIAQIRQGLEEVDLLFDKELYDMASDRLEKVRKLCEKHEAYTYLVEIAYKRFFINHIAYEGKGISKNPVFKALETYTLHLDRHLQYATLSHELIEKRGSTIILSDPTDQAYLQGILDSPLLAIPKEELSFQARLSRNSVLTFIYILLKEPEKEYLARKDNVDMFEQYPHFKKSMAFRYIGALRNYLNYCTNHNRHQEVKQLLTTAEAFAKANKKMRVHLIHFYFAELSMFYKLGQFQYIIEILENKIINHLKAYKIETERIAFICYVYLALTQLSLGKAAATQAYVRKLQQAKERVDTHAIRLITFIELINHFEAGDYEIALQRHQSYLRKAKKSNTETSGFFDHFLRFFRKIISQPAERGAELGKFIKMCEEYEVDTDYVTFKGQNLDCWFFALQHRLSLKDYLKVKFRHNIQGPIH